ncbi:MAG TPA: hypothetical protein VHY76_08275 [Acetobacteraceae bacterium]|nr:hypothetical protein [Acetobacteraceae bacterium]
MRHLAAAAGAWLLCAVLYLALAGSAAVIECVAAAAVATATLALAGVSRSVQRERFRVRAAWLRIVPRVVRSLLSDTIAVGGALLRADVARPVAGVFTLQPFEAGGDETLARGRRALVVLAASLTPNGYALAVEDDGLRLHRLLPRPSASNRRWPL